MEKSVQRIRYPPFEHYDMIPEEIPVIEIILESENKPPPPFKIGGEDDWFIECLASKAIVIDEVVYFCVKIVYSV